MNVELFNVGNIPWDMYRQYLEALHYFIIYSGWNVQDTLQLLNQLTEDLLRIYYENV